MKRLVLLFTLCISIVHQAAAQPEVPLDLSQTVTNFSTYLEQATHFKERFKGVENFRRIQRERVQYTSLNNALNRTPGDHGSEYISGLRIYFGLSVTNEIALYYAPVFADKTSEQNGNATFSVNEPNGGFEGLVNNPNYHIYYAYNGELYDLRADGVEMEDAQQNIVRYHFNLAMKIGYNMNAVESVFIPAQEIHALFNDNRYTEYNTGNIYFTSTTSFENGGFAHTLTMSTIRSYRAPYQSNTNFTGMAADMLMRCPDQCRQVTYPIANN